MTSRAARGERAAAQRGVVSELRLSAVPIARVTHAGALGRRRRPREVVRIVVDFDGIPGWRSDDDGLAVLLTVEVL